MWTAVGQAFSMVFEPYTMLVIVLASLYGLFVGAVPGLTATMATALLVPVLLEHWGRQALLLTLALSSLAGAVVTWLLRIETRGDHLHQMGQPTD